MPIVYSVPCQSQGGWEVDIVRNMVHVLNKYPDAVLLGEFFILSFFLCLSCIGQTYLPTHLPGMPAQRKAGLASAHRPLKLIPLIPRFNTPKNDALKKKKKENLFILLCVQIVIILFTEIPLKVRGYNVFIYQNNKLQISA